MNMKRLLTLLAFFATVQASAQQVNPVPDYVFANRMSAGRNTVTDTAAYFSIGPRYGATRGMMPPMVVDTASFSANKRNGLLIFSVQKNKFLYWDSVGVKWAEMAGTGGSAITGSGVAGYMPEFTTTTNIDTTRLYHSAGRFAIGSTTTNNGVFNVYGGQSYFDTSLKVGSSTFLADEGKNEIFINTTGDSGAYALQVGGSIYSTGSTTSSSFIPTSSTLPENGMYRYATNGLSFSTNSGARLYLNENGILSLGNTPRNWASTIRAFDIGTYGSLWWTAGYLGLSNNALYDTDWKYVNSTQASKLEQFSGNYSFFTAASGTAGNTITWSEIMRLSNNAELLLNTTTDAGDYKLQVSGNIYNTSSALFAATSGNVGIGLVASGQSGFKTLEIGGSGVSGLLDIYQGTTRQLRIYNSSANAFLANNANGGSFIIRTTTAGGTQSNTFTLTGDGNVEFAGNIRTAAPAGGTANDWRLGTVATVSPTSPNRTIEVSIGGTIYYIAAKTTND